MALLEVENLRVEFGRVAALQDVSLRVERGDVVAVIGPNGAGKTSLFNCISAIYRPRGGRVRFAGRELHKMAPHQVAALGVARMFQNLALFANLTVLENLLLGRHLHHRSGFLRNMAWTRRARQEEIAHRARVEQVIEFLHLEKVRHALVGSLPYGVCKRVELGRALSMDPQLLLLDEPTAGLSREETEDMGRYLLDIKEELGITQILIEHELGFVLDLADRVTVLDFGRKIAEGTPAEVCENPAVIAAYLGGAP